MKIKTTSMSSEPSEMTAPSPIVSTKKRSNKKRFFALVVLLILFLALGFWGGRYSVYREYPELASYKQATNVLNDIGKLMELPKGEIPQILTIAKAEEARKNQPFFKDAQDGDVLVVYGSTKQAIIYRPSTNKIVTFGTVFQEPSVSPTPSPTPVSQDNKEESDKKAQ